MGIFIGIAVMMLFLIIIYRGYKISISQKNEFFKIVAFGITTSFALQAFIVIGGVIKFIPMTGATIPFLSYGGSSILSSFISLAVLQYTVRAIIGSNEETEMADVEWYLERYPQPAFCFSPDADFPLICGEKGGFFATIRSRGIADVIVSLEGGTAGNAVEM